MQTFQIIDERRKPMPMANDDPSLNFYRWEQRAILGQGMRQFLVFVDNLGSPFPNNYIEEITTGDLKRIEEDSLHAELSAFAQDKGFLNIIRPIAKEKERI